MNVRPSGQFRLSAVPCSVRKMAEKKLKLVRLAYIKYEEALNRSRFSMIRL